jgi:hypothetical protein
MRKAKVGVLLHRPLGAERDRGMQPPVVDGDGTAVQAKHRLVDREEVADLRRELDVAVGLAGQRHQARKIDGEHHPGSSLVHHDPAGHAVLDRRLDRARVARRPLVDALDHADAGLAHALHQAHRRSSRAA